MERLTELEARQRHFERDYSHEVTIFKGVIGAQGIDIKEIKIEVCTINQRLETLEEDVATLKEDVSILKEDVRDMKIDIKQILTLLSPEKS